MITRALLFVGFPVFSGLTALCFICLVLEISDFGFKDPHYGDLLGWIIFCTVSLANSIIAMTLGRILTLMKYNFGIVLICAGGYFTRDVIGDKGFSYLAIFGNAVIAFVSVIEACVSLRHRLLPR